MIDKYELQVAANHRYAELSIRLADGSKVWIGKDRVTALAPADLAEGEDKVVDRYESEGRMLVVRVEPPAPKPTKTQRRPKPEPEDEDLAEQED